MDSQMIALVAIMALVLIVLPILMGKLTGRSPLEILLGSRANKSIFVKKEKAEEAAAEENETNGGKGNAAGKTGTKGAKGKNSGKEKNSSRQELMTAISGLLSYGRKNRFFCIVPGTLEHGDDVASLAVLMVTRNSVIGFNCFGYGGTIYGAIGNEEWKQVMNGEEISFESPVARNKKQREIVNAVLKECGYPEIRTEIYGVFTAAGVVMRDHRGTYCHTYDAMMETLKGNRFLEDKGVDPLKVGKELEAHCKRQKSKT
jgi:hypothetical protein